MVLLHTRLSQYCQSRSRHTSFKVALPHLGRSWGVLKKEASQPCPVEIDDFCYITAVTRFASWPLDEKLNKLPLVDQDIAGSGFIRPCQKFLSVLSLRCLFMVFVLKC